MRIGIVTLNSHANYGGILQSYAMTKVLSVMGHEARVIYLPVTWSILWYKYPFVVFKRLFKKIFGSKERIFQEKYNNRTFSIVSQYTQRFIDEYISHIVVNKYEELKESDWDCFVVGSDQVWRPDYMGGNVKHAFLSFAKNWNVCRIVYAASFGSDKWPFTDKQSEEYGRLAKRFDAVSVREKSGVRLCSQHWDIQAEHVLDPTMLLSQDEYVSLVNNSNVQQSAGDMLCYILDENEFTNNIIDIIREKRHLRPFRVNSKYEDFSAPLCERIQPPVEQWLKGFMDAKMIVTDSFHACVFSLIFNKPFYVIANKERGISRIESLVSIFDLKSRIIFDGNFDCLENEINWEQVNMIMEAWKLKSRKFIKQFII